MWTTIATIIKCICSSLVPLSQCAVNVNACTCTEFRNVQNNFSGFCVRVRICAESEKLSQQMHFVSFVSEYNYKYAISSCFCSLSSHLCRQISRKVINLMDRKSRVEELTTTTLQAKQSEKKGTQFQLCVVYRFSSWRSSLIGDNYYCSKARAGKQRCTGTEQLNTRHSHSLLILLANLYSHSNSTGKNGNETRSSGFLPLLDNVAAIVTRVIILRLLEKYNRRAEKTTANGICFAFLGFIPQNVI